MDKEKEEVLISACSFPSNMVSDEVKETEAFGLKIAKAIESEWFLRSGNTVCPYYNRFEEFHKLRLYSRGEQPTDLYKDLIANGDKTSYTNYDWRPLQIVPKFVKLVANQMTERLFEIRAEATDKYSTDLKDQYRKNLERFMDAKPLLFDIKENLGVDMVPDDINDFPDTQEEIDVHMNMKYKPAIEIAAEESIKFTLDYNDYDETQSRIVEDIAVLGMGATKQCINPTKGIEVKYVDPATVIYPTMAVRDRNFKRAYYVGEVDKMTKNQMKALTQGAYTDEEYEKMALSSRNWEQYHNITNTSSYDFTERDLVDGNLINVLYFSYKTTKTIAHKKRVKNGGRVRVSRVSDTTPDPSKGYDGYSIERKVIEVWYEGCYVLGTDYLVSWKMAENMVRPKGQLNIALGNYSMYAPEIYQGRIKSLVSRIIPYVDQMQQVHIKIQQMIAKARPNGIFIDVQGLEEVSIGNGLTLTPLEVLKIFDETGNVFGRSLTEEGEFNYGKSPITPLNNGIIAGLPDLINAYNHYLNLLRDAIGIPQGADASMPHPDTLVGVQEQVALNSNIATRHILDAMLNITKNLCNGLSLRLAEVLKDTGLRKLYEAAIGTLNMQALEALKEYSLYDLGIIIDLKPDNQQQQQLEANLQIALETGSITIDDVIDIRAISNIKLANQVLKTRRSKREKEKRDHEKEIAQISSSSQAEAAERAAQAKIQEINALKDKELAILDKKMEVDSNKIETEKNAKAELMEKEFEYNMYYRGLEGEVNLERDKRKDDRADARIAKENKQPSGGSTSQPPMFESREDNISGNIGLDEFEPR